MIGVNIVYLIATVAVIYFGASGVVEYINFLLDGYDKIKIILRKDIIAFWVAIIPSTLCYGWLGALAVISIAYVKNLFNKKRFN